MNIKNQFQKTMLDVIAKSDVSKVPSKYTNVKRNYDRISKIIGRAKKLNLTRGLDFGCAMCFCTVLGQLSGLNVTGVDIPSVGGLKPNGRLRRNRVSPYLSIQENFQKIGYPIKIMDTTKFPWDFQDNEFEFIVMWYSFNKQQMESGSWNLEDRARELSRITKINGHWMVHPASHVAKISRRFKNDKKINMVAVS